MVERRSCHGFPGEQIQCAVAVPGTTPRIVMVNHSNEVFILTLESAWKARAIKVHKESDRGRIYRADDRMSIAAMGGAIRIFWMQKQDGKMLTIDGLEDWQKPRIQSTKIDQNPF